MNVSMLRRAGVSAGLMVVLAAGLSAAEPGAVKRNMLTNRDIVTLANAGFDEDFMVDVILSSRTRFDLSAEALAMLADSGISQRIVEVMMNPQQMTQPGGEAAMMAMPASDRMMLPPSPVLQKRAARAPKPPKMAPVKIAIAENVPYYEWRSVLWGAWTKKVGVAGVSRPAEPVSPQYGVAYSTASQRRFLPVGMPQPRPMQAPMLPVQYLPAYR